MNKTFSLASALLLAFILTACTAEKTEDGRMPTVDVDVDATKGKLPKYDVDVAKVDVNTTTATVTVPDVDIKTEKKEITVPNVDVTMPNEQKKNP